MKVTALNTLTVSSHIFEKRRLQFGLTDPLTILRHYVTDCYHGYDCSSVKVREWCLIAVLQ